MHRLVKAELAPVRRTLAQGVAQVHKMNAVPKAVNKVGNVEGRAHAKRSGTKCGAIGGAVDGQAIKYGPAMEQMASGTMDATLVWGSLPTAVIDNASRQMELRFVSPDPATLETFRSTISNGEYYVYQRIPAASIINNRFRIIVTGNRIHTSH